VLCRVSKGPPFYLPNGRRETIGNLQEYEDGTDGIESRLVLLSLADRDEGFWIKVCCGLLLRWLVPKGVIQICVAECVK
jgi:hypothetical protein